MSVARWQSEELVRRGAATRGCGVAGVLLLAALCGAPAAPASPPAAPAPAAPPVVPATATPMVASPTAVPPAASPATPSPAAPPAAAPPASPQELPRGQLIEKVACAASRGQSYALYLPSGYTPARSWPVLYVFDARGRAMAPARLFGAGAEQYGYIVASSYDTSSDGTFGPNLKAMQAMWNDTHSRFRIDDGRIYAAGFSGTARAACIMAMMAPGTIAGIIGAGAGFPPERPPGKDTSFAFFGTVGNRDFNYYEMTDLDSRLTALGLPHRIELFDGTHQWPPEVLATRALAWMELQAIKTGRRAADPALVAALWRRDLDEARGLAAAGKLYAASHAYSQLAADFAGLPGTATPRTTAQAGAAAPAGVATPAATAAPPAATAAPPANAAAPPAANAAPPAAPAAAPAMPGAAELAEAAAQLAALARSDKFQRDIRERKERERRDQDYLARARFVLAAGASGEDPAGVTKALGELRIAELKRQAREAADPEERLSAERLLSTVLVQTSFYLPRLFSERKEYDRAIFSLSIAAEIEPGDAFTLYQLAAAHAQKGNRKQALTLLEQAVERGWTDGAQLAGDPAFAPLRGDDRFRQLVAALAAKSGGPS
jgi:predicted esterase